MSEQSGHSVHEQQPKPSTAWAGLFVFFIACLCFTVTIVSLAGKKTISAVAGPIGGVLLIIALVLFFLDGRSDKRH